MDVLVYGFARGPGRLPEIMNVTVGGVRLRFRGLSESPCFTGHDAVLLPFDTCFSWMEGAPPDVSFTRLHLSAHLEVLRAASLGVLVGFLFEDCFAHFENPEELERSSLGAMVLADLGLVAARLPGLEDVMESHDPAFEPYLRRFGIAESHLEPRRPLLRQHVICRTIDRLITGISVQEGSGSILFLPGEPPLHFLEFFAELGTALARFRTRTRGTVVPAA